MQELAVVRAGQRIGDRDAVQPHVLDVERDRRRDEPHELEVVGVERVDVLAVAVTTPTRSPRASSGTHSIDAIGVWFAGQRDEPRVLRDVVDQRRLAALDDPARDAFADRERQRVHALGAQAVGGLREQALAVGVEQHDRARLRVDQLADQLRDARQQDARIEVGADQLADLEQHRRELVRAARASCVDCT